MGLAVFSKAVSAIVLSQITPTALENVGWRYYSLFIATNLVAAFVYFFLLPETGGKTLEEIAELFGDTLAPDPSKDMKAEDGIPRKGNFAQESQTSGAFHVEKIV
jgi:hypothetical protein